MDSNSMRGARSNHVDARGESSDSLEQLATRALGGDVASLTELVERAGADVYRLSLRMLWHPEDAEDATQEILFKVVTHLSTFRGESAFRTWMLRIATNHLLNIKRSRIEHQELTFEAFGDDLARGLADPEEIVTAPNSSPDQALLEEEVKIGCTQAMLLCLDRAERVAYVLGDVFELSGDEAGQILGITAVAFRKRLSRARSRVREFMRGHCGLVSATAACACRRRVAPAIASGRVDPERLLFAGQGRAAERRLPILEAVGEMELLHDIAAIHQSHPRYAAPDAVIASVRDLIDSAQLRILS